MSEEKKTRKRYQVLKGTYHEVDRSVTPPISRAYRRGDVFESNVNPLKLNRPGMQRIREVPESTPLRRTEKPGERSKPAKTPPSQPVEDTLDSMTVPELRAMAEAEEIDLEGATRKDQIIQIIRGSTVATG